MSKVYVDISEVEKICEEHKLDEQILKAKDKTDYKEIKEIIDKYLKDAGKKATLTVIAEYKQKLQNYEIIRVCKNNNLDDELLKCNNFEEAMKKINAGRSKDKNFSLEVVTDYIIKLHIDLISKICKDNNLDEEILKYGNDFKKGKESIDKALSDGKKVSEDAVKKYVIELQLKLIRKICKEKENEAILKYAKEPEKVIEKINNLLKDEKKVSLDAVKQYISELLKKPSPDTISDEAKGEKNAALIEKQQAEEIERLNAEITRLSNDNKALSNENENLKREKENLQGKLNNTPESNNNILDEIPELNEILNSNNDRINVNINKELLSKATRFVDEKSLVKLEGIIRNGSDLSSTIVQSILLVFIKQNSLYKLDKQ